MSTRRYRILALDGGGIRGVMSAVWLKQLENRLGGPLSRHFDLIAGTSTGSILASAVGLEMEVDRIIDLYMSRGREVFPDLFSRWLNRAMRVFSEGMSAPKYDGLGLESVLKAVFEDKQLKDLRCPTLIPTYDIAARTPVVFKSWYAAKGHPDLMIRDVCRASSAGPTYFPAHLLKVDGKDTVLIDGGVVANNPTACALAEGVRLNTLRPAAERVDLAEFVVASFGTGDASQELTAAEGRQWGAIQWVLPLIDTLFDGSSDSANYIAENLLTEGNCYRFQLILKKQYELDNADPNDLLGLKRQAETYIALPEQQTRLDALANALR